MSARSLIPSLLLCMREREEETERNSGMKEKQIGTRIKQTLEVNKK